MLIHDALVEELANNVEETKIFQNELDNSFWEKVSKVPYLNMEYMKVFKQYLDWNSVFEYNAELTVDIMEMFFKPLYNKGLIKQDPYEMILFNHERLNNDVIVWLIKFFPDADSMKTACKYADKLDLFWDNVFQNNNLTEEFQKKYGHISSDGKIHVGDKVHIKRCPHGIIGGKDGYKYVVIDSDDISSDKENVRSYSVGRESIYKGWD